MAPLTRARASTANVPTELMARYYAQRADCGLIVDRSDRRRSTRHGLVPRAGNLDRRDGRGWKR